MPDPLLELSTLAPERPTVLIDGKLYELATANDLGLGDQQFMFSRGRRLAELMELPKLASAQAKELTMIVDKMLHLAVRDLPDAIAEKLSAMQKIQLVTAFTKASPELREAAAEAMAERDGNPTTGS